jgi:hypothetical protein
LILASEALIRAAGPPGCEREVSNPALHLRRCDGEAAQMSPARAADPHAWLRLISQDVDDRCHHRTVLIAMTKIHVRNVFGRLLDLKSHRSFQAAKAGEISLCPLPLKLKPSASPSSALRRDAPASLSPSAETGGPAKVVGHPHLASATSPLSAPMPVNEAVEAQVKAFVPQMKNYLARHPGGQPAVLKPQHLLTALILQTTNQWYRAQGIRVAPSGDIPNDLDRMLHNAAQAAHAAVRRHMPEFADHLPDEYVANLWFNAKSTLRKLQDGFKGTAFEQLAPDHRFRMCIDPAVIDALNGFGIDTRDNALLGFVYDDEPSYLFNMVKAWQRSFELLDEPLGVHLIVRLNAACRAIFGPHELGNSNPRSGVSYGVSAALGMTPRGLQSLVQFVQRMRDRIPLFAVVKDLDFYQKRYDAWQRGVSSKITHELLDEPDLSSQSEVYVARPPVPPAELEAILDEWLQKFMSTAETAASKGSESLREAVRDFCQPAERLHPARDGNTRVFGILMLNHLLLRHGHPLLMLHQTNVLDGGHPDEVALAMEEGVGRVDGWRIDKPDVPAAAATSSVSMMGRTQNTSANGERLRRQP